jgi:hypothetical protein
MIKLGYFNRGDLAHVELILTELGITFEQKVDHEYAADILTQITTHSGEPGGPSLNPSLYYFEIEDSDFALIGDRLENYGIFVNAPEPLDMEVIAAIRDYYCPKCSFVSENPGFCPRDQLTLIDDKIYAHRREVRAHHRRVLAFRALIALVLVTIVWFIWVHFKT